MKNLMLTFMFLAIAFTSYSQNETSLLHENEKKVNQLKDVILTQYYLKCNLKSVKNKNTQVKNSNIAGLKYQSRTFLRKFYGRRVIRLT